MPSFSQDEFSQLSTCHIDLQTTFYEVIKTFPCRVINAYRGQESQEKAFREGKTKLHYPYSKHNSIPSMAVDVSPYPIDWKNIKRFYWFGGYVMGIAQKLKDEGKITHSIRYGGDWDSDKDIDDQTFFDLVHFDIII